MANLTMISRPSTVRPVHTRTHTHTHTHTQAGRQAGSQAGRQAALTHAHTQVGRKAGRQAGRQAMKHSARVDNREGGIITYTALKEDGSSLPVAVKPAVDHGG